MKNKGITVQIAKLFAGFDAERYTLPTELIDARARVARMETAVSACTPTSAEQTARAAAVQAALDDPDADLTGPILAAQVVDQASKIRAMVLREAHATADTQLTAAAVDLAETTLAEHLRPKLAEVLDAARSAHQVFSPFGGSEAELFNAAPKIRSAWTEFAASAENYEALVAARGVLVDLTGRAVQDDRGLFAQIRNTEDVWPDLATSQLPVSTLIRPWPEGGGRAFLAWALEAGAELWLPLGGEQDARWAEVYGARVAEHAQATRVMGEYRGALAG